MFRLDGKRALITGGGTGIGFAIADVFVRQGAKVALSGRRSDVLERAAAKLEASHGSGCVIYVQGDVSDVDSARAMVADCILRLGGIELLVNSAGSVDRVTSLESTIEGWCGSLNISLPMIHFWLRGSMAPTIFDVSMQPSLDVCTVQTSRIVGVMSNCDDWTHSFLLARASTQFCAFQGRNLQSQCAWYFHHLPRSYPLDGRPRRRVDCEHLFDR
jgi:NAD(P)-dependent dehydrogenase (short-subunit alcohol dehydrogenase family)